MGSNMNLGIRCYAYMCGGAAWGMLMELKADMVLFAGNTVWSISERLSLLVALYMISALSLTVRKINQKASTNSISSANVWDDVQCEFGLNPIHTNNFFHSSAQINKKHNR